MELVQMHGEKMVEDAFKKFAKFLRLIASRSDRLVRKQQHLNHVVPE